MKTLHPKLAEILAIPGDPNATPVEEQTPEEARAEFASDMKAIDGPTPTIAETRDLEVPGPAGPRPARLYVPEGAVADALVLYFHGGGNIRGDLETHDSTCRVLANASGCRLLALDYRLAPEHPFPAAVEDAHAAFVWAAGDGAAVLGLTAPRIAVAGDSAGGNLAAVVSLRARDEGGPAPAFQLLIYPVTDHVSETESKRLYSRGYLLNSMPFYTRSYLPAEADRTHPHASPAYAESFAGLPPALVVSAGFDPLLDDDVAYAGKLRAAGVPVGYVCHADMIHGFISLRGILPEAEEALNAFGAQLRAALVG